MTSRRRLVTLTIDVGPLVETIVDEVAGELLAGYGMTLRLNGASVLADLIVAPQKALEVEAGEVEPGEPVELDADFGKVLFDLEDRVQPESLGLDLAYVGDHATGGREVPLEERVSDGGHELALAGDGEDEGNLGQAFHGDSSVSRGAESPDEATVEASGCRCGDSRTGTQGGGAV